MRFIFFFVLSLKSSVVGTSQFERTTSHGSKVTCGKRLPYWAAQLEPICPFTLFTALWTASRDVSVCASLFSD